MRFRKRPTEIEAVRLLDVAPGKVIVAGAKPGWLAQAHKRGDIEVSLVDKLHGAWVASRHGPVLARPGDWIIRTPDGGIYPCDPETFDRTYEALP